MAEHKSGRGEQYRPRTKKRVGQMGWSAPSEEENQARGGPVAARGGPVAARGGPVTARGGPVAARTAAVMTKNYFRTFSVAGLIIRPWQHSYEHRRQQLRQH